MPTAEQLLGTIASLDYAVFFFGWKPPVRPSAPVGEPAHT